MSIVPHHLRAFASLYLLSMLLLFAWMLGLSVAFRLGLRESPISVNTQIVALILLSAGVFAKVLSRRHFRRHCREHVARAHASIETGKGFALLLYPFNTRARPVIDVLWGHSATAWLMGRQWPVEEVLVAVTGGFLPLVAFGSPEGAARAIKLKVAEKENWEEKVKDLAQKASVIVFFPGPGDGLSWEFDHIISQGSLARKTLFVRVSPPLTIGERVRAALSRRCGEPLPSHLGFGHQMPASKNMWPMLIDGLYFVDKVPQTNNELELFYLPLMNCHPQYLLSVVMGIALSRVPGLGPRPLLESLHPMAWNEHGGHAIADRALQDVRSVRPVLISYEIVRTIEAAFFASVCVTWWMRL